MLKEERAFVLVSHTQCSTSPCATMRGCAWWEQDFSPPRFVACGTLYPAFPVGTAQQAAASIKLCSKKPPFCLREVAFP